MDASGDACPFRERLLAVIPAVATERQLRQVVEEVPDDVWGQKNLGGILFRQGRVAEAVTPLEKAVQLAPNHGPARPAPRAPLPPPQHRQPGGLRGPQLGHRPHPSQDRRYHPPPDNRWPEVLGKYSL